jgi:3-hydroxymyristoyl/3-hydroxydecanoyl-(acyl carrier protein) dehydratase
MSDGDGTRRGFDVLGVDRTARGERIVRVRVRRDAPQFEGHFHDGPVLPAIAQLADLVLPEIRAEWPDLDAPSGSPRMKFGRAVSPGEELLLTLVRRDDAVRFELRHANGVCGSGTLGFRAGRRTLP